MSRFRGSPESQHWRGFQLSYGQNYGHTTSIPTKLQTEARRAVLSAGLKIVDQDTHRGHNRFFLELPNGSVRKVSMAGSPKNLEHTLIAFKKDLKRLLLDQPNQPERPAP